MDIQDLEKITDNFAALLPEEVTQHLRDVDVIICPDIESAKQVEAESGYEVEAEFPEDVKGVFIGFPMAPENEGEELEADNDGEDSQGQNVLDPEGEIIIVACNIHSEDDAVKTILHEVAHCIGLSEDDVQALGLSGDEEKPESETKNDIPTSENKA